MNAFVAAGACVAALALAAPRAPALPAPSHPTPVSHPSRPAPPLPSLPSIARVRLEVAPDHVVVVEEVNLPRGTWQSGDLDLYVAFGAPGLPLAFDGHVVAVADGALEPLAEDVGEPVAIERLPRRPFSAQPLLGPPQMAGAVIHVREAAFRRAIAAGNMAALRLRSLLALPPEDARGGREVVVRLGVVAGTPLTLGRLQLDGVDRGARPFVTRAEARLCGEGADPYPLAIALGGTPAPRDASQPAPIAPVLAVRHPSDDLCIRFWTAP